MPDKSEKIAVLGAGTMGAGIAQVAAQAGFETLVYDVKQEFIDSGLGRVQNFLKGSRERGKLSAEQEQEILDRFRTSTKLDDCNGSTLVIEAAPERLDLKRDIFKQLDSICAPETLLASNTSSFSVTAIAAATRYQERVLGRPKLWGRVLARFARPTRRLADIDLLALNPHLQRDLGLTDGQSGLKHL